MKKELSIGVICLLALSGLAVAQEAPQSFSIMDNETLTNNWFGFGDELGDYGIEITAGMTNVFQAPFWVKNGQSNKKDNIYTLSVDLDATFDLQELLKIPGASIYVAAETGWHEGIDPDSVGSYSGVNGDAIGDTRIGLTEFYYNQELLDGMIQFKIGKIDVGGGYECSNCTAAFDGNRFADDETCQFLNGGLLGNVIDAPDNGFGAILQVNPVDWAYVAVGASDASADGRDITLDTAFNGHEDIFVITEVGIAPVFGNGAQGVYRIGGWFNNNDYTDVNNQLKNEHYGFYLSFDQDLIRENDQDDQGLGVFCRFSFTDDDIYPVSEVYAAGIQYKGLIPSRDEDVLGIGFASGEMTDELYEFSALGLKSAERVFEAYYNLMLTDYIQIAPDIQYINNAGGVNADALIGALRVQITF